MIWSVVTGGIVEVVKGFFEVKKAKQQAESQYHMALAKGEQDWDIEAQKASRYSWKDELITIIWYSPMYVGWYDAEKGRFLSASEWIAFVNDLPSWWWFGAFGIMAASFGLRWFMRDQAFKVPGLKGKS